MRCSYYAPSSLSCTDLFDWLHQGQATGIRAFHLWEGSKCGWGRGRAAFGVLERKRKLSIGSFECCFEHLTFYDTAPVPHRRGAE